jgi:hypothetical protein
MSIIGGFACWQPGKLDENFMALCAGKSREHREAFQIDRFKGGKVPAGLLRKTKFPTKGLKLGET